MAQIVRKRKVGKLLECGQQFEFFLDVKQGNGPVPQIITLNRVVHGRAQHLIDPQRFQQKRLQADDRIKSNLVQAGIGGKTSPFKTVSQKQVIFPRAPFFSKPGRALQFQVIDPDKRRNGRK